MEIVTYSNDYRCVDVGKGLCWKWSKEIPQMPSTLSNTISVPSWAPSLTAGPEWRSFEQLRTAGPSALDTITTGTAAVWRVKDHTFNILRADDFQKLIGLASEVHRIKEGITLILTAASLVRKYPNDPEGMQMLFSSASLLRESSMLPERDGHAPFGVSEAEREEHGHEDDHIRANEIPRPAL